jgi:GntR family transcriptional regulator/MocR family aminotransferase
LGDKVSFQQPEGGLAAWVHFNEDFPLAAVRTAALERGLLISRTVFHHADGRPINAIRMGFASLSEQELVEAVGILKSVLADHKK